MLSETTNSTAVWAIDYSFWRSDSVRAYSRGGGKWGYTPWGRIKTL